MQVTPLIELSRGGTPECLHFGAIAVVNTDGRLLASVGDAHWLTFTRSTLKPLQALPFVGAHGPRALGFTQGQVAMMCASHNGEDMHVAQVQDMLDKTGLGYRQLRCGCHVPLRFTYGGEPVPAGLSYDERHHNCSGKHAGFLACCVQQGWDIERYLEPDHPLQAAVRREAARAVRLDEQELVMGIDGCSAPNYAMPLSRLALAYARLASGARDSEFGESFALLSEAMTSHPELVSGTGRNDLDFMRAGRGDWVSKVGADGVQVVGSKSRGEAFAIKILDGNKPALFAASVEVMAQLGWLDEAQREALRPWRAETLLSVRGAPVGLRKTLFQLKPA